MSSDDVVTSETSETITQPSRIPGGNGGWITPLDSNRGRELARRRWDNMSQAARLGLADAGEALPAVSARSPLKVVRYLTKEHTLHASVPGARGAVSSFQQVMKMAYPEPEREQSASVAGDGLTIHMDGELAQRLLERLTVKASE